MVIVEDKDKDAGHFLKYLKEFFSYHNLCPLLISMMLHFVQNWSGINVIVFKTVHVFEIVGSSIDKYICTVIVGGVQLLSTGSIKVLFVFLFFQPNFSFSCDCR